MVVEFSSIINSRELGGIPTKFGTRVKANRLFRTASIADATPEDIEKLADAYRVRHIFDFRDMVERSRHADVAVPGAENHFVPVLPELPKGEHLRYQDMTPDVVLEMFSGMYANMAVDEVTAKAYGRFFDILSRADGAPVLWHCTQGKDRTGIGAILLLSALGVNEADAVEDYYKSNIAMRRIYENYEQEGHSEAELAYMRMMLFVMPECLGKFLGGVRRGYGDLEGYLKKGIGLSEQTMERLREAYTE